MSGEQNMTIAEKLKHFRRINCLSQEKLAETSGISIRTIQRIEEGKSVGSGYTINALAKTLNINSADLINWVPQNPLPVSANNSKLKILNLSAITMLLIPLSNVFIPAYIYWKNRDDEKVKNIGSRIVSFQIFWTLGTLLISIVIPALLLLLFSSLRTGSIPLFIPVYFISVFFNIYFVIRFAININKQLPVLQKIPNIL
jgi:XRE family transcriptional regulator, regulator of sulfur utilization